MGESDLVNVRAFLESYGQSTVATMRERLAEPRQRRNGLGQFRSFTSNAVATGELYRSISYALDWGGKSYEVEFDMLERGQFVDRGTRPSSKLPSREMVSSVADWCRVRGLDEAAAYAMSRTILRDGQAARPFFGSTVEAGLEAMQKGLAEAYARDVEAFLSR